MSIHSLGGKHVLVSGIAQSREVFLGRVTETDEPDELTLEGKSIAMTPHGTLMARPFTTLVTFSLSDANRQVEQVVNPEVVAEIDGVLSTPIRQLERASYPFLGRWIESSVTPQRRASRPEQPYDYGTNGYTATNPFQALLEGFASTAKQFHGVMLRSPQVTSTRELDQLSELEGDLVIEMGKAINQIAIRFNQLITNEPELVHYFEVFEGIGPVHVPAHGIDGWLYLLQRFETSKNWARRNNKTAMVREINALMKEGITRVNEIILDHCSALDTLMAETTGQYGITPESYGELSPFSRYTAPHPDSAETSAAPTPPLVGAGI